MASERDLRILEAISDGCSSPQEIADRLNVKTEAVLSAAESLAESGLISVDKKVIERFSLTEEGRRYAREGLPERKLIEMIGEGKHLSDLQDPALKIAIGWARKKGWVRIDKGVLRPLCRPPEGEDEIALRMLLDGEKSRSEIGSAIDLLIKRGLVASERSKSWRYEITDKGKRVLSQSKEIISKTAGYGAAVTKEISQLTPEIIKTGAWREARFRPYNVRVPGETIYPGKIHPYRRLMDRMRRIMLEMGFTEIKGEIIQSSFWNFDALFQPQDHPAREMQDTFYLNTKAEIPDYRAVKEIHERGGGIGSTGWGGVWDPEIAKQEVLRTHTTAITIKYLADNPEPPVKAFCIDRVYRREAIDATHTPEFEQLEGVVMDRGVTFSNLLGILKEFYSKMGFEEVRFRPGYFPYTEPSVEPEVWIDGLGWVELGGAGVFRREVTAPFGIEHPVLAWGLGVSRLAMLRLGLKDLRLLYQPDIGWLRDTPYLSSEVSEMPVVRLYYEDLEEMVGASRDLILERLPMMGADVGKSSEEDYIDVEFFPDRPDLYSAEGVARALQGFLNIKTGLPEYEVHMGSVEMYVDDSVKSVRPIIGCAVVRGLRFTDPFIESLMSLQEDLHWGLGRNRKKVAIGVHDISRVRPPFKYIGEDPDRRTFVPLDFDESMSMREILVRHPKGVAYRHILDGFERFPLIVDADDNVLSFPPIINGELTRVREDTTDLFIDVTGTDPVVYRALNIVVTALAERGGRIEGVRMISPDKEWISPDLSPARWTVTTSEANSLIGFNLSAEELAECLRRMRFGARHLDNDSVEVLVPAYRADIMHTWDIIEDAAKSYGYENLKAEMPGTLTIGRPHPMEELKDEVRDLMVGLGYLEVMPFTLTNEKVHFEMMRRSAGKCTRVMHPISELHTIIRTDVLPGLMEILSLNQHHALPQRLFAVGDVVIDGRTKCHLSAVSIHSGAGFAEISSLVSAIMRELRIGAEVVESSDGAFIPGRGADLMLNGARIGCFGEIHPEVVSAFGLEHPVVGMELELSP